MNIVFIGLDVEASGLNFQEHFVPVIGASVVEFRSTSIYPTPQTCTYKCLDSQKWYLSMPEGKLWDMNTWKDFWINKVSDEIRTTTVQQVQLNTYVDLMTPEKDEYRFIKPFLNWCEIIKKDVISKFEDVIILTDTTYFDIGWLAKLLPPGIVLHSLFSSKGYIPVIDTSSYYKGILSGINCSIAEQLKGNIFTVCKKLGIEKPIWDVKHDHDPANDSKVTVLDFCYVLSHVKAPH